MGKNQKKRLQKKKQDSQISSSASSNFSCNNVIIPDCIVREILIKLPAKLLFRLKCVCKHWLSLISDPSFVRQYQSLHPNTSWTYLLFNDKRVRYGYSSNKILPQLSYADKPQFLSKVSVIPFKKFDRSTVKVSASSNGLLLFKEVKTKVGTICKFRLFNPLTSQLLELPKLPRATDLTVHFDEGFLTLVDPVGVVESYKVVCPPTVEELKSVHKFQVFSSEFGRWKEFNVHFPQPIQFTYTNRPVIYRGILHWTNNSDFNYNVLIAYDPYTSADRCRTIAFPDHVHKERRRFDLFWGRIGCVAITTPWRGPFDNMNWSWKIWTLKDYDKGEWSLDYNFSSTSLHVDAYISSMKTVTIALPLKVDPLDSDIIYFWGGFTDKNDSHVFLVAKYNIRDRSLEVVDQNHHFEDEENLFYADPFLIPSWPTVIPEPSELLRKSRILLTDDGMVAFDNSLQGF